MKPKLIKSGEAGIDFDAVFVSNILDIINYLKQKNSSIIKVEGSLGGFSYGRIPIIKYFLGGVFVVSEKS